MTDPHPPRPLGAPQPADEPPPAGAGRPETPSFGPTYGPSHAPTYGPLFPPTPPYGTALGPQRRPPVTPPARMSTGARLLVVLAVLVAAALAVVPVLGVAGFVSGGDAPPTAAAGPAPDGQGQPDVTTPPGPEFRSLTPAQWAALVADPESYIGQGIVVYGRLTELATAADEGARAVVAASRLPDADGYATRVSLRRADGWKGFSAGDEVRVYGVLRGVDEDATSGDDLLLLEAGPYGIRRYQ